MNTRSEQVKKALQKAVEVAGSQSELARRMNAWPHNTRAIPYAQQYVSHWLSVGNVPAVHAPAIEWAVGGAVGRADLCPGIFDAPATRAA